MTLMRPEVLSRAEALGVKARGIVEGLRVGDHKSPFRGFSVEFVQHREYVPGDDIRHIDWKSYGRSERYTIKQYEQETNFTAHVVVDASSSMNYGEGDAHKLEYAKLLATALSYTIIRQRDSVGLHLFDKVMHTQLPASSNMMHINTITATLEQLKPREKNEMGWLLIQLADQIKRRGLVFLISDFFDDVEGLMKGVQAIRFRGHEVILCHVMHRDEIAFPFEGNVRFLGMEEIEERKTRPHLIRPGYLKAVREFMAELKRSAEASRCDYMLMDTSIPLEKTLTEYLIRRLQTAKL